MRLPIIEVFAFGLQSRDKRPSDAKPEGGAAEKGSGTIPDPADNAVNTHVERIGLALNYSLDWKRKGGMLLLQGTPKAPESSPTLCPIRALAVGLLHAADEMIGDAFFTLFIYDYLNDGDLAFEFSEGHLADFEAMLTEVAEYARLIQRPEPKADNPVEDWSEEFEAAEFNALDYIVEHLRVGVTASHSRGWVKIQTRKEVFGEHLAHAIKAIHAAYRGLEREEGVTTATEDGKLTFFVRRDDLVAFEALLGEAYDQALKSDPMTVQIDHETLMNGDVNRVLLDRLAESLSNEEEEMFSRRVTGCSISFDLGENMKGMMASVNRRQMISDHLSTVLKTEVIPYIDDKRLAINLKADHNGEEVTKEHQARIMSAISLAIINDESGKLSHLLDTAKARRDFIVLEPGDIDTIGLFAGCVIGAYLTLEGGDNE